MSVVPKVGTQPPYQQQPERQETRAAQAPQQAAESRLETDSRPPESSTPERHEGKTRDSMRVDSEKNDKVVNMPEFDSWSQPPGSGVDARDRSYAAPQKNANPVEKAEAENEKSQAFLNQAHQNLAHTSNPGQSQNDGTGPSQGNTQVNALTESRKEAPNRQNRSLQLQSQKKKKQPLHGRPNNGNSTGSAQGAAGNSALQGTGGASGAPASRSLSTADSTPSQARNNDGELSVKRDQAGQSRLQEASRGQTDTQEQATKKAQTDTELGKNLGAQAKEHAEAKQGQIEQAGLNNQKGTQNLQLADQNTQSSQKSDQMGKLQDLMAKAQKKIQQMEKAKEAQGKAVEKSGKTTETQGKTTETTGQGVETTGHTTETQGHATEGTGVGMQASGQGLMATGAALAAGLFTAPAGAALLAQGAVLEAGGLGLQAVGKGLQATGKGLQAQGKGLQATGKQTQNVGKLVQNQGKQQQEKAKQNQQKAKKEEDKHKEASKKLLDEAKKFLQQAAKNKGDAGKNFSDAGKNMDQARDQSDKHDQAVDQADKANKSATGEQEKANKANDNLRALQDALKQAFGQEGTPRPQNQEQNPEAGALGSPGSSPAGVSPSGRSTTPGTTGSSDPVGADSRKKQSSQAQKRKHTHQHPARRNPLAALLGGPRGSRPQSDQKTRNENTLQANFNPMGDKNAPRTLMPVRASFGGGRGRRDRRNRFAAPSAPSNRKRSDVVPGSGFGHTGTGNGLSNRSQFDNTGAKEIAPVQKAESYKGTATHHISGDNVTVKLNELSSSQSGQRS